MKKETTLSVLKDIRNLLAKIEAQNSYKEKPVNKQENLDWFKITFPEKTAKEIYEECGNKLGEGKLLYNIDWYKDEDFFTKEKTIPRAVYVKTKLEGLGKNWNECDKIAKEKGGEMLNFAEGLYLLLEYYKTTAKRLLENEWSWTSSLSRNGYLVNFGDADGKGAYVINWPPQDADGGMGFFLSRSKIRD